MRSRSEWPIKRELVLEAEQWEWSSYRTYGDQEAGRIRKNEDQSVAESINFYIYKGVTI